MSITIITAGLGGLILGSGGTYYLLNPRLSQAEAEKTALAEQLRAVTDQLHRLQGQVADLQQQVKLSSLSSVEPMAHLSEAAPVSADSAEEVPLSAESAPLEVEMPALAIADLSEAPDFSPMPVALEEEEEQAMYAAAIPPQIEPLMSLAVEHASFLAEPEQLEVADSPQDESEVVIESDASSVLELASSDPLLLDFEPESMLTSLTAPADLTLETPVPTPSSMDSRPQELPDPFAELPLELSSLDEVSQHPPAGMAELEEMDQADSLNPFDLGLDAEATWVHSESDFQELTAAAISSEPRSHKPSSEAPHPAMPVAAMPEVDLGKAKQMKSFDLGLDAEATWTHPESDFQEMVAAALPSEPRSHKPSSEAPHPAMPVAAMPEVDLGKESFDLGLDAEATWVHSESDFQEMASAALPSEPRSHKSSSEAPEAVIPAIELSQESDMPPFSLGTDPEATWVYPEQNR